MSISLAGLGLTCATMFVFVKHNDTPVVKSSTRELSYIILLSMLACYCTTFFLVAKPSGVSCLASRVLPGAGFAFMYGALVTKTNRIARILAGSKKRIITKKLRFMSAGAQVVITLLIVCFEAVILTVTLFNEPAGAKLDYPSDDRVVLVCNVSTFGLMGKFVVLAESNETIQLKCLL